MHPVHLPALVFLLMSLTAIRRSNHTRESDTSVFFMRSSFLLSVEKVLNGLFFAHLVTPHSTLPPRHSHLPALMS
jgi:hypothetical protein